MLVCMLLRDYGVNELVYVIGWGIIFEGKFMFLIMLLVW